MNHHFLQTNNLCKAVAYKNCVLLIYLIRIGKTFTAHHYVASENLKFHFKLTKNAVWTIETVPALKWGPS